MVAKFKAIIFDLDGTLIDSAPVVGDILNSMRGDKGLELLDLEKFRQWSSEGGAVLVGNALQLSHENAGAEVEEFRSRYFATPTPINCLYPGVLEILEDLSKNNISLSICSNKPENLCKKVLKDLGLFTFFDQIVGGDTLPIKKPDPTPLCYILKEIGKNTNEVLYVGDSGIDKKTAMAANVRFAFFSGGYESKLRLDSWDIQFDNYCQLKSEIFFEGPLVG